MADAKQPRNARHLFAVARCDGFQTGGDRYFVRLVRVADEVDSTRRS
jgi:hypothetical protein